MNQHRYSLGPNHNICEACGGEITEVGRYTERPAPPDPDGLRAKLVRAAIDRGAAHCAKHNRDATNGCELCGDERYRRWLQYKATVLARALGLDLRHRIERVVLVTALEETFGRDGLERIMESGL